MSSQQPIGSGFGPHSTTTDVLTGVDLTGRLALVTGGYVGLGLETTRALCSVGAQVVDAPPGQFAESGVCAYAVGPDAAARPWAVSADLTGMDAFS